MTSMYCIARGDKERSIEQWKYAPATSFGRLVASCDVRKSIRKGKSIVYGATNLEAVKSVSLSAK
jgi:hypothetical protein